MAGIVEKRGENTITVDIEDKTLRNARNDVTVSKNIKEYFSKNPNSMAKECCRFLKISYEKYGNRAKTIKCRLKKRQQSTITVTKDGRVLKPHISIHRKEYTFREPVPAGYVDLLKKKASTQKIKGNWHLSSNRNRQLIYFDDFIRIQLHQNGNCRIFPNSLMPYEQLRVHVDDAFTRFLPFRCFNSKVYGNMINSIQIAERHVVFDIDPKKPFKNRYYHDSLGIDIVSDKSHPNSHEVHEYWPIWIPILFEFHQSQRLAIEGNTEILSEFGSQIESHLKVMKGIGTATDYLNESICKLNRTIDRKANSNFDLRKMHVKSGNLRIYCCEIMRTLRRTFRVFPKFSDFVMFFKLGCNYRNGREGRRKSS